MRQPCRSVDEVIQEHRRITRPVEVPHLGHRFRLWPGVFSPFIAPSGYLSLSFASWPIFAGARVLDIGSGSGIPTCLFALNGAEQVIGVDINPAAVEAGRTQARNMGIEDRVRFLEGDLFDPLSSDEDFDIIFADLPFTSGKPVDMLERAFYDPDLISIRNYISSLSRRLISSSSTQAYLCMSDLETHDLIDFAAAQNLAWREVMHIRLSWIGLVLINLELRKCLVSHKA